VDAAGPEIEHQPGQPRSARDAAFLKRFDAVMQLPIIVSAILPLLVVPESSGWVGIVIGGHHNDHWDRRPGYARGFPGELLPGRRRQHRQRVISQRASNDHGHA
jgi:hypothetical protein